MIRYLIFFLPIAVCAQDPIYDHFRDIKQKGFIENSLLHLWVKEHKVKELTCRYPVEDFDQSDSINLRYAKEVYSFDSLGELMDKKTYSILMKNPVPIVTNSDKIESYPKNEFGLKIDTYSVKSKENKKYNEQHRHIYWHDSVTNKIFDLWSLGTSHCRPYNYEVLTEEIIYKNGQFETIYNFSILCNEYYGASAKYDTLNTLVIGNNNQKDSLYILNKMVFLPEVIKDYTNTPEVYTKTLLTALPKEIVFNAQEFLVYAKKSISNIDWIISTAFGNEQAFQDNVRKVMVSYETKRADEIIDHYERNYEIYNHLTGSRYFDYLLLFQLKVKIKVETNEGKILSICTSDRPIYLKRNESYSYYYIFQYIEEEVKKDEKVIKRYEMNKDGSQGILILQEHYNSQGQLVKLYERINSNKYSFDKIESAPNLGWIKKTFFYQKNILSKVIFYEQIGTKHRILNLVPTKCLFSKDQIVSYKDEFSFPEEKGELIPASEVNEIMYTVKY